VPKNKITDLRNHLFETIEALKDKEDPMDIGRARAIADVAGVIVESAKVEVQVMHLAGETGGEFFDVDGETGFRQRRLTNGTPGARERLV
jgi:hypothetical protein